MTNKDVIDKGFNELRQKIDMILEPNAYEALKYGLTVYRTEKTHPAYKGKALWGDGLYLGLVKEQVADMTTDTNSISYEEPDWKSIKEYRIPSGTKLKEFNLDKMKSKEFNVFPRGNKLKQQILNEGYDGVILITSEDKDPHDTNLGGDQVIIYNSSIINMIIKG